MTMPDISTIKVSITFNDPELDSEELEEQALRLMAELRQMDEVEDVSRVLDPTPPEGSKAIGRILVGLLTAQVNGQNVGKLLGFLGYRLAGRQIELAVEENGRKLTVKAYSREELDAAIIAAKKFLAD
jgi:hypothetical protein